MTGKVHPLLGPMPRVHRERNASQPSNVHPKAAHQTRPAQTSSRACESRLPSEARGVLVAAEGTGPGTRARAPDRLSDLLPALRGPPASRGARSRVIISSPSLESWTVQPRVLLAAGRPGPRGHIIPGRGCVRSGRPRRHRATSVPPGRAAGEAPDTEPPPSPLPSSPHHPREWASAGSGRDPGGGPPSGL